MKMFTPKAFANFSPGFERSENPGNKIKNNQEPCKGSQIAEPFQGLLVNLGSLPRVVATLQPWAEISQRLRR